MLHDYGRYPEGGGGKKQKRKEKKKESSLSALRIFSGTALKHTDEHLVHLDPL